MVPMTNCPKRPKARPNNKTDRASMNDVIIGSLSLNVARPQIWSLDAFGLSHLQAAR